MQPHVADCPLFGWHSERIFNLIVFKNTSQTQKHWSHVKVTRLHKARISGISSVDVKLVNRVSDCQFKLLK